MKKFICEAVDGLGYSVKGTGCGEIDYYLMDGYDFGDRVLEGVMFRVSYNENDEIVVATDEDWSDSPYLVGLNEKYWLEQALANAQGNDIGECQHRGNCKGGNEISADPTWNPYNPESEAFANYK